VQRKELDPIYVDSAFTFSVVLGVSLWAGCWFGSDLIERMIGTPGVGHVLKWMSLSLIGMGFGCVLVAMQRRKLEFRSLALRSRVQRRRRLGIGCTTSAVGVSRYLDAVDLGR
jgi:O-antigen/teichoic acid export membrane protein